MPSTCRTSPPSPCPCVSNKTETQALPEGFQKRRSLRLSPRGFVRSAGNARGTPTVCQALWQAWQAWQDHQCRGRTASWSACVLGGREQPSVGEQCACVCPDGGGSEDTGPGGSLGFALSTVCCPWSRGRFCSPRGLGRGRVSSGCELLSRIPVLQPWSHVEMEPILCPSYWGAGGWWLEPTWCRCGPYVS